jgi:hypothetical protein
LPIRDDNIDLINDPIKRAQELYREQVDAAIAQLLPQPNKTPLVKMVHRAGATMEQIRNV